MEGIVDDCFWPCRGVVFLDHLAQGLAAVLRRERDDGRGAAERRGHRAAVEIVGADDPGRGFLLDMAMAIDRAGQHELAAGVDLARARRQPATQGGDHAVLDADVAVLGIGGRDHRAVADDEIVIGHARSPRLSGSEIASLRAQ